MKRLALYLCFVPIGLFAQGTGGGNGSEPPQKREISPGTYYWDNPAIPTKDGKIFFNAIMDADGTADQLYERALKWASMDQLEPYNIILFEDEEAKQLIVQRSFRYILGKGSQAMRDESQKIKYQIKLQFNDGKYQYTMTDFKDFNADYDIIEYLDIYQVSDKSRQQYESQIKSQIIQAVEGYRTKRKVQLGVIDKLAGNMRAADENQ
jgi:hypothetical protein